MNLLILGANSDVAYALAAQFANQSQCDLYLASRDQALLEKKATDLGLRYGVKATPLYVDVLDYTRHAGFYEKLDPKPDGVILAFGYLGDQARAQTDFDHARRIIDTNFTGAVSVLEPIAADFERRGHGFIIGLSSVAGDRGRKANYIYGAAKGAFSLYLGGLRNRLAGRNVHVLTVLPGFIHTKMTENLELPQKLTAEPEEVAADVYRAWKKGRHVIYTKWFWRWIMLIIRSIPEFVFKHLSI